MTNEELVAEIQHGREDLLPELWDQVQRFVRLCAIRVSRSRYRTAAADVEDLYNSGYLALVDAAASYDPVAGGAFITWLELRLRSAFAEALGYRSTKQARDPIHTAASLDAPLTDEDADYTLLDTLEDPAAAEELERAEEEIYQEQLRKILDEEVDHLRPDYAEVIRGYYFGGQTDTTIARKHGITTSAINVKRKNALRRLRWSAQLRAFVEDRTPYKWTSKPHSVEDIVIQREYLASIGPVDDFVRDK